MSDDPYEVLGVADGVSPEDLKKAYYRKIRQHPPETDPDGFQRVQRAYETAKDPEYPTRRRHGAEIDRLTKEADELFEKKDYAGAARPLKRVLLIIPESQTHRYMLAICQANLAEWDAAKKTYTKLVEMDPNSVQYRTGYAWVFINQANSMDRNPEAEARLGREARAQLDVALRLEPGNPTALRAYSKSYDAQADWPRAIEWGEKAAAARGVPDEDDYSYLLRLYVLADRRGEAVGVADRLGARLPEEGRKQAGLYLAKLGLESFEKHLFSFAYVHGVAAFRLNPEHETVQSLYDDWVTAAEAGDEYERLKEDKNMNPAVRYLCVYYMCRAQNQSSDEPYEAMFQKVKDAIGTWEDHEIAAGAKRVQTEYPALYNLNKDTFDTLAGGKPPRSARKFIRPRARQQSPVTRPALPSPPPSRKSEPVPPPTPRATPLPPAPPQRAERVPARKAAPAVDDDRPSRRPSAPRSYGWSRPHRGGLVHTLGRVSVLLGVFAGCLPLALEQVLGVRLLYLVGAALFAILPLRLAATDLGRMSRGEMDKSGRWRTIRGLLLGILAFAIFVGWVYLNIRQETSSTR